MRVYLAAPYAARDRLRALTPDLTAQRMVCTSSWLGETHPLDAGNLGPATQLSDAQVVKHALKDLSDVRRSNALVAFTAAAADVEHAGSGGRHVETGYALALGLPVVVVGEPENVFHRLGDFGRNRVVLAADWKAAVDALVAHRDRGVTARAVR